MFNSSCVVNNAVLSCDDQDPCNESNGMAIKTVNSAHAPISFQYAAMTRVRCSAAETDQPKSLVSL